jgi:hypothetical protein
MAGKKKKVMYAHIILHVAFIMPILFSAVSSKARI